MNDVMCNAYGEAPQLCQSGGSDLPLTGLPLVDLAIAGIVLLGIGLALRKRAAPQP